MTLISSLQNDRVKLVRALQKQGKARRRARQLVLEGARLMEDAFQAGAHPDFVFYDPDAITGGPALALLEQLRAGNVLCLAAAPDVMREMADTENPQGVLGVYPWPDRPAPDHPRLVLVADQWRDPGNLGTIIRTAAAAGVDQLVLTPGTVDPFSPKVLRAGMGAHYRLPIQSLRWEQLVVQFQGMAFYLADAAGDVIYSRVDWGEPSVLVIGGEAHGLSTDLDTVPHQTIRIPMMPGAESLNAAVSASILVYEARRHAFEHLASS